MQKLPNLTFGKFYHVYGRGVNRQSVFFEEKNFQYFLDLYIKYMSPVADTFCYCLMPNHFHLLIRIKLPKEQCSSGAEGKTFEVLETSKVLNPTQQLSNLLNGYAKAINKAYGRTGGLFEGRFGRIEVTSPHYFVRLVHYIHLNPQKHGFVRDFREYPFTSYGSMLTDKPTRLERETLLGWFGGLDRFATAHKAPARENGITQLLGEDD